MEHIRGRARSIGFCTRGYVGTAHEQIGSPVQPTTTWYIYSSRPLPPNPLPIYVIRIKKRTCTPSTVVTGDIAAAVIQNTAIPENNTWIDVGWRPAQRPVLDTYSQPRLRGRWVIARIYR